MVPGLCFAWRDNIEGATLMWQLVLRNQVMVGSVNASRRHFQMAVDDLDKARETWGRGNERPHHSPISLYPISGSPLSSLVR